MREAGLQAYYRALSAARTSDAERLAGASGCSLECGKAPAFSAG